MKKQNILVIKHGSLGDWILATGAFKLIRKHHPTANIIMLTQSEYYSLAQKCMWFNEVWTDNRLPIYKIASNFKTITKLRSRNYDHVYDLQCSSRTNWYHLLTKGKIKNWYGRAKGCSHYIPFNDAAHSVELSHDIIKSSGINELPSPDISWLKTNKLSSKIKSLGRFVLFIPGSSAKHLRKRWTASGYAKVIKWLAKQDIKSVLIGTEIDRKIIEEIIREHSSASINLINQTHFTEMVDLAQAAQAVIGSDTGPMHLAAITQTHSLVLFSAASDPNKSKPWGSNVHVLREKNLIDLSSNKVLTKLIGLLQS